MKLSDQNRKRRFLCRLYYVYYEEAISSATELKEVLRRGGFDLKNQASNSSSLMDSISPNEPSSKASISMNMDGTIKATGIAVPY